MPVRDDLDSPQKLKAELKAVQEENARAAALFSSISEGVIVADHYGKIEQVNDTTLALLGYSERELLNKWFIEKVQAVNSDGSPVAAIDRPITQVFLTGESIHRRMYYLTKKKTPVPVEISVAPIIINGTPAGAIEVFRDLSDEYAREQIQSGFISLASHQLRTPLSSINTYAQMLSQGYAGQPTDEQKKFLTIIENSAARMNELINTLLNVTRIEAGNINVKIRTVDLAETTQEIISGMKPQIEEKKIQVHLRNLAKVKIETDPTLIAEVISNLISNAIKYTPNRGKFSITISAKDRLVFTIRDSGYGIPLKSQPQIFSKFFRASNVTKTDVSGTGLGLYLVKQIIEKLEGDVWFTSKLGAGSAFHFSLPLSGSAKKQGSFTLDSSA